MLASRRPPRRPPAFDRREGERGDGKRQSGGDEERQEQDRPEGLQKMEVIDHANTCRHEEEGEMLQQSLGRAPESRVIDRRRGCLPDILRDDEAGAQALRACSTSEIDRSPR